jgi:hypothetical protein
MKKVSTLLLMIGFMGACTHKTNFYNFETIRSVTIDESKTVLTSFPTVIKEVNDSTIAIINAGQKLSLYNLYSGINTLNFSTENINFDSLIQQTFQKKYAGEREFIYNKQATGGLSEGNCQLLSFDYTAGLFYIYANTLAQVNYMNDSLAVAKFSESEKVKEMQKKNADATIRIMNYLNFIIIVDNHFNLKEIVPLYEKTILQKDNYTAFYQKGFAVSNNKLYAPIQKNNQTFEQIASPVKWDATSNTMVMIDLKNKEQANYRLSIKDIDYNGFSLHDYFGVPFSFSNNNNTLQFSNGKEICEIENSKKIFAKKNLSEKEWIQTFNSKEDGKIVMTTYRLDKKLHPTDFEKSYAIDSLNSMKIKLYDTQTSTWTKEKELPIKHFSTIITSSKIIYFDKDNTHYYLKYISYNEN